MNQIEGAKKRGKEILSLLKDHGPISIDLLQKMTAPPMPKTNLRQSLRLLRKKGLITVLPFDSHTTYYQLCQYKPKREIIAQALNCSLLETEKPLLRRQDLYHNQWCEYWTHIVHKLFPDAKIVTESSVGSNVQAKRLLQISSQDLDLTPDFLLILPKSGQSEQVSIAFEVERTRKSNSRILRKFKKYMDATKIDGLIYICDTGRLAETIRCIYEKKLQSSPRIKHYGQNFFLFSDSISAGGPDLGRLFNMTGKPVSFVHWCNFLRSTKWTLRKDVKEN